MKYLDAIVSESSRNRFKTPAVLSTLENDLSSHCLLLEMKNQAEWMLDHVALVRQREITPGDSTLFQELERMAKYQTVFIDELLPKLVDELVVSECTALHASDKAHPPYKKVTQCYLG